MELTNEYEVAASVDTLWDVLNDVERVAPFVPGFELQEVDGETYRGTIKIKVGAITASYNAEIEVLERNRDERRVVMEMKGRERRGPGSVHAQVTSRLQPAGAATKIRLDTEVQVTGRVAQFGSGVLSDVSGTLLRQFVGRLEDDLRSSPAPAGSAAENGSAVPTPLGAAAAGAGNGDRPAASASGDNVLDVGAVAGRAVLKRAAPVLAAGAMIAVALYLSRTRR